MLRYLLLIFTLVTLSSCFDIIEDVKVNSDGTGSVKFTFSFFESREFLTSVMNMDSLDGFKVPSKEEIEKNLKENEEFVEAVEGIDNYQYEINWDYFIFKMSFDFDSIQSVNTLFQKSVKHGDDSTLIDFNPYSFSNGEFHRYNKIMESRRGNKLLGKYMSKFSSANYISIYRFDKEIESVSHPNTTITKDGKSCVNKLKLVSIINKQETLDNKIILKK